MSKHNDSLDSMIFYTGEILTSKSYAFQNGES